jgi:folate-binding protein YgfZ
MDAEALPPLHGACRLDDWALLCAQGPDAASFLHGQLTQDVAALNSDAARLAGYCSAKGRLQATCVIWRPEPERVLLACHRSLAAAWLKRLQMFVLRARCKLSDVSEAMPLWGVAGPAALELCAQRPVWGLRTVQDGGSAAHVIRLPDAAGTARALWIGADAGSAPSGADARALGIQQWEWLWVQSGVPMLSAATVDQFVPQMVNLELLDGVNFRKGCYPGQEVVARSQYRGTIKRRLFLLHGTAEMAPAQEVFHSLDPEQAAGMVVNAAPRPLEWGGGWDALVELKRAASMGGSLHLGSAQGSALQIGTLPYDLPQDEDTPD